MIARDYYAEAHKLAGLLVSEGLGEWAERFEEAISGGSVATEILLRLRWVARQLVDARLPLTGKSNRQLQYLLEGLEDVLHWD